MRPARLLAATSNLGKLAELLAYAPLLNSDRWQLEAFPDFARTAPPDETGATFEDNARLKAAYYSGLVDDLVLADDSGLAVEALHGEPGVRSARYAGPFATSEQNTRLLLERLTGIADRRARFVCVLALAQRGQIVHVTTGSVEGRVTMQAAGSQGFGYDPVFYYPPLGKTFGQMSQAEKLPVSHRGRAIERLFAWFAPHRPTGTFG